MVEAAARSGMRCIRVDHLKVEAVLDRIPDGVERYVLRQRGEVYVNIRSADAALLTELTTLAG